MLKLCKDVLLLIIKKLDNPSFLFSTCKYFNEFGKRHNLRGFEVAIKEIFKLSPYSSICGCPQEQLKMIKSGQETVYTVIFDVKIKEKDLFSYNEYKLKGLKMGAHSGEKYHNVYPHLFLKGSPFKKGVKIPIFGYTSDNGTIYQTNTDYSIYYQPIFEFEIVIDKLEKTDLWFRFCKDAIKKSYNKEKRKIVDIQYVERNKIMNEKKNDENIYIKLENINIKLENINAKYKQNIKMMKKEIYNNEKDIIIQSRQKLIEQGKFNNYVYDFVMI